MGLVESMRVAVTRVVCVCVVVLLAGLANAQVDEHGEKGSSREFWVATVSGDGLAGKEQQRKVQSMLQRMQEVASAKPDLICLPELFAQIQITDSAENVRSAAELSKNQIVEPIASFAREHHCNIVCPVYVIDNGKIFNSALAINREGQEIGRYDKIHTTLSEMELGVSPGAAEQKVIETDLGKLGIQICYDIEWQDGWQNLREQGAEIVVWPSAFGGGKMVMTKAWENRCYVISSTGSGLSRICDSTGEVIAATSRWKYAAIASVNLEQAFLHTWPSVQKFSAIERKYGRKVRIRTLAEEEWSILESLSPEVSVQEVMREFELESRDAQLQRAEERQKQLRP